jgi:hypothetical protein
MEEKSPAFEKTYRDYLAQVAKLDIQSITEKLGVQIEGDEVIIPLFGKPYRVSARDIIDPLGNKPLHAVNVLLCKYLLLCPDVAPREDDWVSYKDFKDAAPFVDGFSNNAEKPIAKTFSSRLNELNKACKKLGGRSPDLDLAYDVKMRFDSLPKVPVFLLFNDEDDEFPAQCSVLFERRAAKYLDMECLAIIGWLLSDYLKVADGGEYTTIM